MWRMVRLRDNRGRHFWISAGRLLNTGPSLEEGRCPVAMMEMLVYGWSIRRMSSCSSDTEYNEGDLNVEDEVIDRLR